MAGDTSKTQGGEGNPSPGNSVSPDRGEAREEGDSEVQKVEKMAASPASRRRPMDATSLPYDDEPGNAPPLPDEDPEDDGWDPVWDPNAQAYYFYNRFTQQSQWTNPRVPDASQPAPPGVGNYDRILEKPPGLNDTPLQQQRPRYDPAIHGDYDPTADYAQEQDPLEGGDGQPADPAAVYAATGVFNRFTGKWQHSSINPENHNDENKSKRQMSAFFDVDAAANSHNGKSLKAERSGKKLSKQELKAFKEKRKERKEEKRRAWLRD